MPPRRCHGSCKSCGIGAAIKKGIDPPNSFEQELMGQTGVGRRDPHGIGHPFRVAKEASYKQVWNSSIRLMERMGTHREDVIRENFSQPGEFAQITRRLRVLGAAVVLRRAKKRIIRIVHWRILNAKQRIRLQPRPGKLCPVAGSKRGVSRRQGKRADGKVACPRFRRGIRDDIGCPK